MTTWFTSDLHLDHQAIIRLCNRPFGTLKEMNDELVNRWNDCVEPNDVIFVLGDFCWSGTTRAREFLSRLNGFPILIRGNHDKQKAQAFPVVLEATMVQIAQQPVILSHYPYVNDRVEDEKYKHLRPVDRGLWLIHGHVHEKWRLKGRMINVSVDAWDWKPVSRKSLEKLITRRPGADL